MLFVSAEPSAASAATACAAFDPVNSTTYSDPAVPVTATLPIPIDDSPSRMPWRQVPSSQPPAVTFQSIAAVFAPLNDRVNVPPSVFSSLTVCFSFCGVRPEASTPICCAFAPTSAPVKSIVNGPPAEPETLTLPEPMELSPRSAAWTHAPSHVANVSGAVVAPPYESLNEPAGGLEVPVNVSVCSSFTPTRDEASSWTGAWSPLLPKMDREGTRAADGDAAGLGDAGERVERGLDRGVVEPGDPVVLRRRRRARRPGREAEADRAVAHREGQRLRLGRRRRALRRRRDRRRLRRRGQRDGGARERDAEDGAAGAVVVDVTATVAASVRRQQMFRKPWRQVLRRTARVGGDVVGDGPEAVLS